MAQNVGYSRVMFVQPTDLSQGVDREIASMRRILEQVRNQHAESTATLDELERSMKKTGRHVSSATGRLMPVLRAFLWLLVPFSGASVNQLLTALETFATSAAAIEQEDRSIAIELKVEQKRTTTLQRALDEMIQRCIEMSADEEFRRRTQDQRIAYLALHPIPDGHGGQRNSSSSTVVGEAQADFQSQDDIDERLETLQQIMDEIKVQRNKVNDMEIANTIAVQEVDARRFKSAQLQQEAQAMATRLESEGISDRWWITEQICSMFAMLKFW